MGRRSFIDEIAAPTAPASASEALSNIVTQVEDTKPAPAPTPAPVERKPRAEAPAPKVAKPSDGIEDLVVSDMVEAVEIFRNADKRHRASALAEVEMRIKVIRAVLGL